MLFYAFQDNFSYNLSNDYLLILPTWKDLGLQNLWISGRSSTAEAAEVVVDNLARRQSSSATLTRLNGLVTTKIVLLFGEVLRIRMLR